MQINITAISKYTIVALAGAGWLLLGSMIQPHTQINADEYYYSDLLRNNYSYLVAGLFLFTGFISGYFFDLHPWLTGLSLVMVFLVACFYEMTVYRGSHNLIPIELGMYLLFASPGIVGNYLGRFLRSRSIRSK